MLLADGLFVGSGLFYPAAAGPDVSLKPLEELFRARIPRSADFSLRQRTGSPCSQDSSPSMRNRQRPLGANAKREYTPQDRGGEAPPLLQVP